ncbi:MAG: AsmA-like C-terminal region-containing protein, partial [Bacteroidales bacterium]
DTTLQQGKTLLNAIIGFDGLELKLKNKLKARAEDVALQIKTSPLKDTTMIASMSATIGYSSLEATINDSIQIRTGAAKSTIAIAPSKRDKKLPLISSMMKFDSLYAAVGEQRVGLELAAFDVKSEKAEQGSRHWISTGVLGFKNLKLFTPDFPLIISMPASRLSLGNDAVTLNGARVHVGSSDLTVTGQISNLKNVFFDKATLFGKMSVTSDYINCNEITKALEMVPENNAEVSEAKKETAVEEPMKLFIVPDGVDFVLDIDIRKVLFGKLEIENIKGEMIIRNRSIELMNLNLHTMSADMNTTLVYSTKDTTSAYTGFDLKMKDIIVGKLVEFIPALDTLVPMLRSIDGRVNFNIAAEARLDSTMSIDIQSIQSAAKLKGDSLVLMDGETFSQISKMLRFKNRERNVIDSVSVDLVVRNGQIEIYPFLIGMDRYLAAVGGKHNIDMTFDYHVSLLKSPIPFNVGVDIKGSMDDFKFKITKAKYKDLKNSVRNSPVDSAGLSVRNRIKEVLYEEAKSIQLKRKVSDTQFNK